MNKDMERFLDESALILIFKSTWITSTLSRIYLRTCITMVMRAQINKTLGPNSCNRYRVQSPATRKVGRANCPDGVRSNSTFGEGV